MNTHIIFRPCWSTASFGTSAAPSPLELAALGTHLRRCQGTQRHLFALRCAAQTLHGFVATRFVTSLLLLTLLMVVASLVL